MTSGRGWWATQVPSKNNPVSRPGGLPGLPFPWGCPPPERGSARLALLQRRVSLHLCRPHSPSWVGAGPRERAPTHSGWPGDGRRECALKSLRPERCLSRHFIHSQVFENSKICVACFHRHYSLPWSGWYVHKNTHFALIILDSSWTDFFNSLYCIFIFYFINLYSYPQFLPCTIFGITLLF